MLELSQICLENHATLKTVCFSLRENPHGTKVRCTVTLEVKGVKYLIFGEGSHMEAAFASAIENVRDGEWRVAKFQE